jgi:hypothetical protein
MRSCMLVGALGQTVWPSDKVVQVGSWPLGGGSAGRGGRPEGHFLLCVEGYHATLYITFQPGVAAGHVCVVEYATVRGQPTAAPVVCRCGGVAAAALQLGAAPASLALQGEGGGRVLSGSAKGRRRRGAGLRRCKPAAELCCHVVGGVQAGGGRAAGL